ncbi:MAG TPA: DUF2950 domain-containing protein [Bryobacteraceae bacterium]|nr:DUF2950 domain-containing protein [Bryobacteraceae bacterium]
MTMRFSYKGFAIVVGFGLVCAGEKLASAQQPSGEGFSSPSAAAKALLKAAQDDDVSAALKILGPSAQEILETGDPVEDKNARKNFADRAGHKLSIIPEAEDPTRRIIQIGDDAWPLPIPLVQKNGKWYFDVDQGKDVIKLRRIGDNELSAINVCRGFVEAENEYNDKQKSYAQKFFSSEGKHDGLYWPATDPNDESPVAEAVAKAMAEGYTAGNNPFHGYRFKILTEQGSHAPGGAMSYIADGAMTKGFGVVAWPAEYRVTGVMTFVVNRSGIVYEKDLGADTEKVASAITAYDPDDSWNPSDVPTTP